jgi:hypothetical protein
MSRIYEALKQAQEQRSKSGSASGDGLGVMEMLERRGSPRPELDIDLTVYGHTAGELPFYEQAKAIRADADGGLFLLVVPVLKGQDLLLINNRTSKQEQFCRVVNVTMRDVQTYEVEVVFPSPNGEFWGLPGIPSDLYAASCP